MGRTLEIKGDLTNAAIAYSSALSLNESNFDAHFNLATIYAKEGDTERAEKHYLASIELEPDDVDSHYNLGQLYQNTEQYDSAIKQFTKVVELDEGDWRAVSKLVQLNEAVNDFAARDAAVNKIYDVWRADKELREQGFYIREQSELNNGKLFALEYFELVGERARKFVFKLQDQQTGDLKFEVSLGSYEHTTEFARDSGSIGPDDRRYHMDGYSPNGSHYTYAFFDYEPPYEVAKTIALKALSNEQKIISSTEILKK